MSGVYFYFLLHGKEFRVVFSSAEWFGTEFREFASILFPRNRIPSCGLFRRRVWNRIMWVCFNFWFTERNSELFSLPRKGSERNSEIFCSAEQPELLSEITICSVYSVFRRIFFLSEIPNPSWDRGGCSFRLGELSLWLSASIRRSEMCNIGQLSLVPIGSARLS
jgi:hypothetical protein